MVPQIKEFAVTRGQSRYLGLAIVGSVLIKAESGTTCLPPPSSITLLTLARSGP